MDSASATTPGKEWIFNRRRPSKKMTNNRESSRHTFTGDFDGLQTDSEKGAIFYKTFLQSVNALICDAVVPEIYGFKRLCGFLLIFVIMISIIIINILIQFSVH